MTAPSRLRRVLDRPSPLLKQLPTLAALLIACVLTMSVDGIHITNELLISISAIMVFVATLYAAWRSARGRYEGFAVMLIPMIDIVAFGLFRTSTGGTSSLFGSLLLIPVVWLAAAPGVRYVVFVAVLSSPELTAFWWFRLFWL